MFGGWSLKPQLGLGNWHLCWHINKMNLFPKKCIIVCIICLVPCFSSKSMDGISESIGDSSAQSPNPLFGTIAEPGDGQKIGEQEVKQENCVP